MVRPSGPMARDRPPFRMASRTECVVKGETSGSRGWCLWRCLITLRVSGLDLCGMGVVNCLLNAAAIARWEDRVVELKVIGWLGAVWVFFPESDLMSVQNLVMLCLCEHVSTVCTHVSLFVFCISRVIWLSRVLREGSVGLVERRSSRRRISRRV